MKTEDVMDIIVGAAQFFRHFFSAYVRWDREIMPFQRGAYLRLYGIPLHAWNESFFKLCVMDCGRYLCTDACTLEKERFDFARVLVATSSMEVLNVVEELLVDGVRVEIKIIEEWGFNLGDDACLLEKEEEPQGSESDYLEDYGDRDHRRNVDILVEKIADAVAHEDEVKGADLGDPHIMVWFELGLVSIQLVPILYRTISFNSFTRLEVCEP
ncbi:sulfate transporter, partial [Trifolium medium]|nr:sulfate transporter [Trifolium medium]